VLPAIKEDRQLFHIESSSSRSHKVVSANFTATHDQAVPCITRIVLVAFLLTLTFADQLAIITVTAFRHSCFYQRSSAPILLVVFISTLLHSAFQ